MPSEDIHSLTLCFSQHFTRLYLSPLYIIQLASHLSKKWGISFALYFPSTTLGTSASVSYPTSNLNCKYSHSVTSFALGKRHQVGIRNCQVSFLLSSLSEMRETGTFRKIWYYLMITRKECFRVMFCDVNGVTWLDFSGWILWRSFLQDVFDVGIWFGEVNMFGAVFIRLGIFGIKGDVIWWMISDCLKK